MPIYHVDDRIFLKCLLELSDKEWLECRVIEGRDEYKTDGVEYDGTHPLIKAHDSDCAVEELEDHFRIKEVVAKAKYLEAAPKKPEKKSADKKGDKKVGCVSGGRPPAPCPSA